MTNQGKTKNAQEHEHRYLLESTQANSDILNALRNGEDIPGIGLKSAGGVRLYQGVLPSPDGVALRFRETIHDDGHPTYTFTVKTGTGLSRGEYEWDISHWVFMIFRPFLHNVVVKDRYLFGESGWTVDLAHLSEDGATVPLVIIEFEGALDEVKKLQTPSNMLEVTEFFTTGSLPSLRKTLERANHRPATAKDIISWAIAEHAKRHAQGVH